MESLRLINFVGSFGILGYMARDLDIGINLAQANLVLPFIGGLVLGQFIIGVLSDRYGRVNIFVIFLNIYAISSLVCVFSKDMLVFSLFRILAGFTSAVGEISSRAIVNDFFDLKKGVNFYSKICAYSFILVGLAPLFLDYTSALFGWRSFFVFNAIYCCIVSATAFHLLNSLGDRKSGSALTVSHIKENFKATLGNDGYLRYCILYILCAIILETSYFFLPIIILDHFHQSKHALSILYGIVTGVVGYLSCLLNTRLLKFFSPLQLTRLMFVFAWVFSLMHIAMLQFKNPIELTAPYLIIFYLAFFCTNIMTLNLFVVATQSMKSKVGSGFVSSLTVSLYTLGSLLSGYFVSLISLSNLMVVFCSYSLFVLAVLALFLVCYSAMRKTEIDAFKKKRA